MADPKSAALPLGDAPIGSGRPKYRVAPKRTNGPERLGPFMNAPSTPPRPFPAAQRGIAAAIVCHISWTCWPRMVRAPITVMPISIRISPYSVFAWPS